MANACVQPCIPSNCATRRSRTPPVTDESPLLPEGTRPQAKEEELETKAGLLSVRADDKP
jgi:hypothetical protein